MFTNNLKVAWRNLRKNKTYTAITVIGLTVGITAALLIYRMVSYELSFNKNFENYDRIVRVVTKVERPGQEESYSVCIPIPAMQVMEETVGQFEAMSRVKELWVTLSQPDPNGGPPLKKFNMEPNTTAFFVQPSFFQIFDLDWIVGDAQTALAEPNTIVLTKSWAERFFDGPEVALGQTLLMDNVAAVTVKGVVADLPSNCDFSVPFFSSYTTLQTHADYFFYDEEWGSCSSNNQVYALLSDKNQMDAANDVLAKVGQEEYADRRSKRKRTHHLQPFSDLHFDERLQHSGTHIISKSRLRILGGIGILILIMACFNFINLATAQSSLRAKEVGVRKTLGGQRSQLIGQFMSETALIVGLAVVMGVNLAAICAPLLKHVSDVPDALPFLTNPMVWGFLAITTIAVTLLAGLYPSMVLSKFKPVTALRNKVSKGKMGGVTIRKSLVILQFVIAQALIISAIITLLQLDYIRTQDLGFSKDLVYTFSIGIDSSTIAKQAAIKQEILQIPTVEAVSFSSDQPFSGNTWANNFRWASRPEDEPYSVTLKFCDADYQKTYGLNLLAGKWYPPSDTIRKGVINHTLLRKLGLNDASEAIGQHIQHGGRSVLITGVAEDFHTHSFRQEHMPLLMTPRRGFYWEAGVKIRSGDLANTTAAIQKAFDKILPEQVFTGRFLDEFIAEFYEDDDRLAATCKGFGILAILISCLGLLGLAAHAAQQRIKEIGVRKILGATASSIVGLLSKDFLKLVALALVVASPLAYYFMKKWLDDFVYRIDIEWWVFAIAGLLVVAVAFFTVGFQGLKAALANPIDSLRSE